MKTPPNLHSNFFSSLEQVEKRLKLETPSPSLNLSPPLPQKTDHTSTESLSSPIFLYPKNHLPNISSNKNNVYSETPIEFLSNSIDFPSSHHNPLPETPQDLPKTIDKPEYDDVDEIGLLIEHLGLSDYDGYEQNLDLRACSSCHCEGGFYDKIVGVKGPKCGKELERLEGWIRHFEEERNEPLRLAHLLLGKAAFNSGEDGGFDGLEFPSTVEEFLQIDSPIAKEE